MALERSKDVASGTAAANTWHLVTQSIPQWPQHPHDSPALLLDLQLTSLSLYVHPSPQPSPVTKHVMGPSPTNTLQNPDLPPFRQSEYSTLPKARRKKKAEKNWRMERSGWSVGRPTVLFLCRFTPCLLVSVVGMFLHSLAPPPPTCTLMLLAPTARRLEARISRQAAGRQTGTRGPYSRPSYTYTSCSSRITAGSLPPSHVYVQPVAQSQTWQGPGLWEIGASWLHTQTFTHRSVVTRACVGVCRETGTPFWSSTNSRLLPDPEGTFSANLL